MTTCADEFVTGECSCGGSKNNCGGGAGCSCGDGCFPASQPATECTPGASESRGGCTPVLTDPFHIVSGPCKAPTGGDMTVRAPIYVLTIENPLDGVLRDSDGRPILDENGKVVAKTA